MLTADFVTDNILRCADERLVYLVCCQLEALMFSAVTAVQ
jgi:hypothetical protein